MISTGIDHIAQTNNAYAYLTWAPRPAEEHVLAYLISYYQDGQADQVYTASTVNSSLKIGSLYPGVTYWFAIQVQNAAGLSPMSQYMSATMPSDNTAPAIPTGLTAVKSLRGALVSCNANTEGDLQGYLFRVSVGEGAWATVNTAPQLSTYLNYQAPSGTLAGTILAFEVAAMDWAGNQSDWSAAATAVQTDGLLMDELLAGNITVFGTITGGGFRTSTTGARLQMDASGLTLYANDSVDRGGGAGVTVHLDTATGNGFFSGTIAASSFLTGGIQSATGQAIPTIPPHFTGFQIDPIFGMRFYKTGILQAQFAANGEIDVYSGANLNLNGGLITGSVVQGIGGAAGGAGPRMWMDLTQSGGPLLDVNDGVVDRVQVGSLGANGASPSQYGVRVNDASGAPIFDSLGLMQVVRVALSGGIFISQTVPSNSTFASLSTTDTSFTISRFVDVILIIMVTGAPVVTDPTQAQTSVGVRGRIIGPYGGTTQIANMIGYYNSLGQQSPDTRIIVERFELGAGSYTVSVDCFTDAYGEFAIGTTGGSGGSILVLALGG